MKKTRNFLSPRGKTAIIFALSLFSGMLLSAQSMSVLKVKDGKLYKDGKEYRAFGLNVSYLSDRVLRAGKDAKESFEAIEYLGRKKVPFIRTWLGYLNNWKPYFNDEKKYWENMDLLVDACEKANIGMVPTLFWKQESVPWEFNETQKDMMNPDSEGRKFMREYIKKFVTRYRNRKIIWIWEWSNEVNYFFDLPHQRRYKNRDDIFTYKRGLAVSEAFAKEVRKYDPNRPISTGNGSVRPDLYNRGTNKANAWQKDTLQEQYIAAYWSCPDPFDIFSIHKYVHLQNNKCDLDAFRKSIQLHMKFSNKLKKPLFIGEFGLLLKDANGKKNWSPNPDIDYEAYKKYVKEMYRIIYQEKVPLAAWWVYTTRTTSFHVGVMNPEKYGKFEWILDIIKEYNDKIAKDMNN